MRLLSKRLLLPVLVAALFGVLALLPVTDASAASAAKSCALTGSNQYTCTFTITPGMAIGPGAWLVQMVPGPGAFVPGTSTVTNVSGCTGAASITAGTAVTSSSDMADYDVTIGAGGCGASAVVVVTETVAVTSSGQICQKVWVTAAVPFAVSCATVVYTPPPPPAPAPSAVKSCTLTSTPNVYTCLFTVTPGFPAAAVPPSPNGDYIHVNEPPGPPMTGPGTILPTPTVVSVNGCSSTVSPVTMTGTNSFKAWMGVNGCPGGTWSVTFSETVVVTASGQICQSFYMVAAVPPTTACATVVFTPPAPAPSATKSCTLTGVANVYTCLFTVTPGFPAAAVPPSPNGDYIHVNEPPGPAMTGPGTFTSTPTVASVSGCSSTALPVVLTSPTSYNAWMGINGCSGTTWSVTFSETVAVTASGQLCQSFWMVAAVPPTTACAVVNFTKSLPVTPAPGKGTFASPPIYSSSRLASVVFLGGTPAELDAAVVASGGAGAWAQDSRGVFLLYIVNGGFVNDTFKAAFPDGIPNPSALTVVGK